MVTVNSPDPFLDAIDGLVGCRGPGGDAHCPRRQEPIGIEVAFRLNVMDARTMTAARVHELTRVVAARAANDDDDVALACQRDRGVLALLCRLTDRVDESDIGL